MADQKQDVGSTAHFFAGLLVGGLAGAAVSLLMTPQSGKETRGQIQQKGLELRDQAAESVEAMGDVAVRIRVKAGQITADLRQKAEGLQKQAQDVAGGQIERLATVVKGE
jgi:gas vesicle protein